LFEAGTEARFAGVLEADHRFDADGFYLKVLQSGSVNTGDNWDLQDRFDSAVSLELVNQAAYRPFEADVFGQVLRSEGLVPEWKDMLLAKLNAR